MARMTHSKYAGLKGQEEDFWSRVGVGSAKECWLWVSSTGYNTPQFRNTTITRVALALALNRPLRWGFQVTRCPANDLCCNPNHLREGGKNGKFGPTYNPPTNHSSSIEVVAADPPKTNVKQEAIRLLQDFSNAILLLLGPTQSADGWRVGGSPTARDNEPLTSNGAPCGLGREFYRQIGAKGGRAVLDKYGPQFYSEIGKRGGAATWKNNGKDHQEHVGRMGIAARQSDQGPAQGSAVAEEAKVEHFSLKRPPCDVLYRLVWQDKKTVSDICRLYSISDRQARTWLADAGVPYRSSRD